ncbi:hypothetical protein PUN28_007141 [Cardiocondyla obscurior]|uniref:Uncharacterized protein n=1 Tax=Cardiocondyla obscurior TaxID=286306 RepID=A0AAW2G3F3_9HYME
MRCVPFASPPDDLNFPLLHAYVRRRCVREEKGRRPREIQFNLSRRSLTPAVSPLSYRLACGLEHAKVGTIILFFFFFFLIRHAKRQRRSSKTRINFGLIFRDLVKIERD